MRLPDPPILVITDRAQCPEPIENRALALFRGGCRWLSLREPDLAAGTRLSLLKRIVAIAGDFGAAVSVHGDVPAALSCGTALHLPAGADIGAARRTLGTMVLIGQSSHDEAELTAAASGADYATLGPIAPTSSKPGYFPAHSREAMVGFAAGTPLPVLALGGVTTENAAIFVRQGFSGIAVMGEAMRARDPERWFAELAAATRSARRSET